MLGEDEIFQKILGNIKDEKEQRVVKHLSEKFLASILGAVLPMAEEMQKNPDNFKNGIEELEAAILTDGGKKR